MTTIDAIAAIFAARPHREMSPAEVAQLLPCPPDTLRKSMNRLVDRGVLRHHGYGRYSYALGPEDIECSCHG